MDCALEFTESRNLRERERERVNFTVYIFLLKYTHPDNVVVMRAAHRKRNCSRAGAPAKVGVIAAGMEYPVAPTDLLEAYVELVPTAFLHVGLAVAVAFGPVSLGQRCRLDYQERLESCLHRDRSSVALDRTGAAGHLNRVVQSLLLHPLASRETHVRFYPALCGSLRITSFFILSSTV